MTKYSLTKSRYLGNDYLDKNPTWDAQDAPWKARQVEQILARYKIAPDTVAEVGCGAGAVLVELRQALPGADLWGFDIAPAAAGFWANHGSANINFQLGDYFELSNKVYDVLLMLDVLEHLQDPFDFLSRLHGHAGYFVFHIPLDLSALSVLRETPLLYVRNKVGHLHYYTRGLALALLEDCGYKVVGWHYTGASSSPQRTWRTRLASVLRKPICALSKDFGVRLLGGETMMVLARSKELS